MTEHRPSAAELAEAAYRKSSYSGGGGNECVEVATVAHGWVAVRDSKKKTPVLAIPAHAFAVLVDALSSDAM